MCTIDDNFKKAEGWIFYIYIFFHRNEQYIELNTIVNNIIIFYLF